MHKQRLDFLTPQPAVRLRANLWGGLTLLAGVMLALGMIARQMYLLEGIEQNEAQVARLMRSGPPIQASAATRKLIVEEVKQVNQVAEQLTIPWNDLFLAVESASSKRIALLSLQPDYRKRELRIAGEADDFESLRAYTEHLGATEVLLDVRLVNHEVVSGRGPGVVRFEVLATWRLRA
jgi:hypothetical protein